MYTINNISLSRMMIASLLAVFSVGCSEVATVTASSDNTKKYDDGLPDNAPTYLMAVEAAYPPFAFRDEQGYVIGYDGDIIKAVAKSQGFRVKLLHQSWSGIFDSLEDGSRHILGSGAIYTDERSKKYEVSKPISGGLNQLFVLESSGINSFADITGKVLATQGGGATMFTDLQKLTEGKAKEAVGYPTLYLAFKAVLQGKADGVYGNSGVLSYYINNMPEGHFDGKFKAIDSDAKKDKTVFYLQKGNTELLNKINTGIDKIRADGTYAKINQKWFGKPDTL